MEPREIAALVITTLLVIYMVVISVQGIRAQQAITREFAERLRKETISKDAWAATWGLKRTKGESNNQLSHRVVCRAMGQDPLQYPDLD
jgi:hypothetical protein